jgi:hypothetical protein
MVSWGLAPGATNFEIPLTAALIFELSVDFPANYAPMGTRFKGEQVPR